jgi:hypothetical protein
MDKAAKKLRKHLKTWAAKNPNMSWANHPDRIAITDLPTETKLSPEQMEEFGREIGALPPIDRSKLSPQEIEFLENHELMSAVIFKNGGPGANKSKIGAKLAKKQGIPVKKLKPSKLPTDFGMPDPVPPVSPMDKAADELRWTLSPEENLKRAMDAAPKRTKFLRRSWANHPDRVTAAELPPTPTVDKMLMHELVDRVYLVDDMFDRHVVMPIDNNKGFKNLDPEITKQVATVSVELGKLYGMLGKEHMK